ncbi:MAG TPA: sulfatase-like hydrolase/transferase, partial [Polyangiales bacterium]|nr:sulfatase-like hydrolase/transferase [Polyangiales bacterium]
PPVIAIFGDHGEEFGEHGGSTHGTTAYAEQTRVGFLLAGPNVPTAQYAPAVSTISLPNTLLDLLGLPALSKYAAPSLLPAMQGRAPWPAFAVSEMPASGNRLWVGYLAGQYHLLRDPVHDLVELFDLERDPREQHDIAAEQPELLASLLDKARAWDATQ